MLTRRHFGSISLGAIATAAAAGTVGLIGPAPRAAHAFAVNKSNAEWKKILTPAQYRVLREEGTERAYSSPLDSEKRAGTFHCAGCQQALFSSKTKYDSGTGWPSFYKPLPGAVGTKPDPGLFGTRTEVHCSNCGGHLGHVFNDGPAPTGKRYCMNGVAMTFKPA